ncbi:hypothetical protein FSP39_024966 [Pinctada imbricata]|uniref:B box-type domain-containing protein n=1 Tax=Pinctada imbricata TaxID=66713 RepID=A0AA88XLQ5_PINIB|nr:hypothetical protein FSP39_024966 [Pinctada imbricata]
MSLSKEEGLVHAQTAVSCNLCESEAPGEHYCHDCKHTLCSQCELIHSKLPSTKGHKIVLRTQIHDIDTRTLTCEEHGEDVTYHCEKCKIPICGKCVTTHHRGHELSDLDVLFQRNADILQNYISKMQADVLPGLNKKVEETRKARDCYEKKVDQVQKEMEEENLALHKQLDKIQRERLKKTIEIKESDLLVFDKACNRNQF